MFLTKDKRVLFENIPAFGIKSGKAKFFVTKDGKSACSHDILEHGKIVGSFTITDDTFNASYQTSNGFKKNISYQHGSPIECIIVKEGTLIFSKKTFSPSHQVTFEKTFIDTSKQDGRINAQSKPENVHTIHHITSEIGNVKVKKYEVYDHQNKMISGHYSRYEFNMDGEISMRGPANENGLFHGEITVYGPTSPYQKTYVKGKPYEELSIIKKIASLFTISILAATVVSNPISTRTETDFLSKKIDSKSMYR